MASTSRDLVYDIIGDFQSCWYFAVHIFNDPPIDKRVALVGVAFILIIPFFIVSNESYLLLYFARVLFASLATFAVLTWSNTFWFLMKKSWMYKVQIKNRKSINYFLKDIKNLTIDDAESENPEGALYIISNYYSEGYKYHAIRNAIEVIFLLIVLLYTLPLFFLFNLGLISLQFFWVMLVDNQSSSQVFNDLKILIFCIHKLYKLNSKNCKEFIFKNKMESVRELGVIYMAVEKY